MAHDGYGDTPMDPFDRAHFTMRDFPHRRSTIRVTVDGLTIQTWVIETFRAEGHGDTVLIERMGKEPLREVLKPEITAAIARHREQLSTLVRSNRSKAQAADRRARGQKPGFQMTPEERAEAKRRREAKARR